MNLFPMHSGAGKCAFYVHTTGLENAVLLWPCPEFIRKEKTLGQTPVRFPIKKYFYSKN
jgi:hypothetical protein